ncbi:hypothetical protein GCM10025857_14030 [Alicyclobacillus contaminans]|nr:hypothetical protein GCM10025857_14030 [Alicyclobacillus contaminans]
MPALVGLGANGMVQVGLQKDMRDKTDQLAAQVKQAQGLSGRMTSSLAGLPTVQQNSEDMAQTLNALAIQTAEMNQGLAQLQQTVQGIADAVQALAGSTTASGHSLGLALNAANGLSASLETAANSNRTVLQYLQQMEADQTAINQDLQSINAKTAWLP